MTIRPLFGYICIGNRECGSSPESLEFLALLDDLFPEECGRHILGREFRLWLNERTGLQVENGSVPVCMRQWLPRLREMAAEKERAA
jgi:hypothetical protein